MSTSESIYTAIQESDWMFRNSNERKLVTITMNVVQRPIKLKAGRIFDINLQNFFFVSTWKDIDNVELRIENLTNNSRLSEHHRRCLICSKK